MRARIRHVPAVREAGPGPDPATGEHRCHRSMCPPGVAVCVTPSAALLHRALVGWERFLDTFEEVPE
ncbi:hypothetical protein ACQKM2_25890 [Streptomyces sp. NPDC004126]|uniref:hypothetical protein n=1 Tax=Streptomyces sp. NPDC004126 TaxID=3390695 RepID=UPI003CFFD1D1